MHYFLFFIAVFFYLPLWSQGYEVSQQLEGHYGKVTFLMFHPQEEILISGDELGQILVWNITSGEILKRFLGHQGKITHLAFDSTAKQLLSAAYDGSCLVWNVETSEIQHKIENSSAPPYATVKGNEPTFALWNNNESTIIYGGYNRKIHQFDVSTNTTETLFETDIGGLTSGLLSANEQLLFFGINENIYQYNIAQKQLLHQLKNTAETKNYICELNFVPTQENLLAAWTFGGQLQIWDISAKRVIQNITATEQKGSSHFAFSTNGEWLVTGNQSNNAILWKTDDWQKIQTLQGHTQAVKTMAFSKTNKYIATGSEDKTIIVWKQPLATPTPTVPQQEENNPLQTAIDTQRPIDVQNTYKIEGNQMKISIADDAQEDGDILSLIFNDQVILDTYELKKRKKILVIPITQKDNYLVVYAHNEGSIPPNTIAIRVESLNGQKDFRLRSNINTSAALKIMLED